jgi:chemotaxis regulatin CheY-phosphate phosphatase CheZ
MSAKQPSELLYDSEATLRLVDNAIQDMGELDHDDATSLEDRVASAISASNGTALGLVGLSDLLAKGYAEILGVLDSLRQSRNLLERAAVEKIQHTHDKLREVTDATETAATDILNGLDRANTMVDDLDAYAGAHGEPDEQGASTRAALRDELFALMGHMQFQDITSQQLTYASAVLTEMEARLTNIARAFDPSVFGRPHLDDGAVEPGEDGPVTYDPNASTQNREERQAVADEIIAAKASA